MTTYIVNSIYISYFGLFFLCLSILQLRIIKLIVLIKSIMGPLLEIKILLPYLVGSAGHFHASAVAEVA